MVNGTTTLSNKQLLLLFFFSGITSLLFQLGWMRYASEIFGSTVAALSSVTAIYFGGVALGSFFYSKKTEISTKTYGTVQLLLGSTALLSLLLFWGADSLTAYLFELLSQKTLLTLVYRLTLLTLIIGPASFFSGATFPLMMGLLKSNEESMGRWSSLAYGINAFGAVVGALLAGIILLPFVGIWQTMVIGALINGAIALWVSSKSKQVHIALASPIDSKAIPLSLLVVILSIGFVGMGTEMLWARFLTLVIHSTVYTAMITVATVITGLAVGSFIAGKFVDHSKNLGGHLFLTVLGSSITLLIAFFIPAHFWHGIAQQKSLTLFLLISLMILPPLFSGMSFPILLRLITPSSQQVTSASGLLNTYNTIGAITGSLLIGLIAIPTVGFLYSFYIVLAIQLLTLILIVVYTKALWQGGLVLLPLLIVLLTSTSSTKYLKPFLAPDSQLIYLNEGVGSDVTVTEKGGLRTLEIDRMWQGENRKTRQIMAAHIPMLLLGGQTPNVLVIGVGPGVTAKRFLMYPAVDSLHLVDLEPAVFEAAENYFGAQWLSNDPRVTKIVADGRQYIRYTKSNYSLISIEIGQMFRPHSAQFYTKDFYEQVSQRLTKGGVVSQFIPVASFDLATFKSVIRTFTTVFPEAQLWYNRDEFILLGSKMSIPKLNPIVMTSFTNPGHPVGEDLDWSYWGGNAFKLTRPEVLAGGFLMGKKELKALVGKGDIYRDNQPSLEYFAARNPQNKPFILELESFLTDPLEMFPPVRDDSIMHAYVKGVQYENLTSIIGEGLLRAYFETPNIKLLQEAYRQNPNNLLLNHIIAESFYKRGDYKESLRFFENAVNLQPDDYETHFKIALAYLRINDLKSAFNRLHFIISEQPNSASALSVMGSVLANMGQFEDAKSHLERALAINPQDQSARENLDQINSQLRSSVDEN